MPRNKLATTHRALTVAPEVLYETGVESSIMQPFDTETRKHCFKQVLSLQELCFFFLLLYFKATTGVLDLDVLSYYEKCKAERAYRRFSKYTHKTLKTFKNAEQASSRNVDFHSVFIYGASQQLFRLFPLFPVII